MIALLHESLQTALHQKRVGVAAYLSTLANPPAEPGETDVRDFIAAVKLSGLTWAEVRADFLAREEKIKLELRIKEANAAIDRASAEYEQAAKALKAIFDEKVRIIGDKRAVPLNQAIAESEATMRRSNAELDASEQALRRLRADFPRVFGIVPDITL